MDNYVITHEIMIRVGQRRRAGWRDDSHTDWHTERRTDRHWVLPIDGHTERHADGHGELHDRLSERLARSVAH
jgi:hypothetical protein